MKISPKMNWTLGEGLSSLLLLLLVSSIPLGVRADEICDSDIDIFVHFRLVDCVSG